MATNRVNIELDEELVRRAREQSSTGAASDSDLIAAAVTEWLAFATLDRSSPPKLDDDSADELAVAEVRAHRASRSSGA